MFNSDYEIRLATLAALGGDTSVTYDSVYSIDLEILRLTQGGGGGGLDYNQIKALLASSGVTEIVFHDSGDTTSVTLDYELLSKIGQGGGDYICVDSIDALSGITNPKDGMVAYISENVITPEKEFVVVDFYGESDNDNIYIQVAWGDGNSATIRSNHGGNDVAIENDYGNFDGKGSSFGDIHNHRSELPIGITFNNGATAKLVSNAYGSLYPEKWECINTFYFDEFEGEYPTITITSDQGVTFVQSSVTEEEVTIDVPAKGLWRYYADEEKWLAYDVNIDKLSGQELQDVCNNYHSYLKPLSINWLSNDSRPTWRKGFVGAYDNDESYTTLNFTTNPVRDDSDYYRIYARQYFKNNNIWRLESTREFTVPASNDIKETVARKIYTYSQDSSDLENGGLYSVPYINIPISGVVVSTTITVNPSGEKRSYAARWRNNQSGRQKDIYIGEDGFLFNEYTFEANTGFTDWVVIDYREYNNSTLNRNDFTVLALKVLDNGDDTFTISYFISGELEDPSSTTDFSTNNYEFNVNSFTSWTKTTSQTINVLPHLYSAYRGFIRNNTEWFYMLYKLV